MQHTQAIEEASRCLLCHDPPCRAACPAGIDPRTFIRKIRLHDLAGAARHLRAQNVFSGVCAELCPVESLCVGACLREKLGRPIDIPGLQRHVCDWEREGGELAVAPMAPWREAVAVVGAGPAGLACAAELARRGFAVTVFEAEKKAGGMLRHAIPVFRLPDEVLEHDLSMISRMGVTLRQGEKIAAPAELRERGFAAVFVATGCWEPSRVMIPGAESPHVHAALAFLRAARTGASAGAGGCAPLAAAPGVDSVADGDTAAELRLGARVVVIGGGDTAIDAARVLRRGGRAVTVLYRRAPEDMPAHRAQVLAAQVEGVEFLFQVVPLAFVSQGAALRGVRVQRVRWESGGRRAREPHEIGEPFVLPCDDAIVAVGQRPFAHRGLRLTRQGLARRDPETLMTADAGVFVGGDLAGGPGTVVTAVADGMRAAAQIDAHLSPAPKTLALAPAAGLHRPVQADLGTVFCGVRFANPFVLAAGPATDDLEMLRAAFRAGWAGAVLKTTAVAGTPVRLAYPLMAGMDFEGRRVAGLGNIDLISTHPVDEVVARVRALKAEFPEKVVIASIMGATREEWQSLARQLTAAGADLLECSFSCPQGTLGSDAAHARGHAPGLAREFAPECAPGNEPSSWAGADAPLALPPVSGFMLGQNPELVREIASWVKEAAGVPVVIKITPQVTDLTAVARAIAESGADGICASNTIPALMGIDLESGAPQPDVRGVSTYAGLSGPAILPITLRTIAEVARHARLPITGTGGPESWRDAAGMLLVGATTVQFCTAVMRFGIAMIADLTSGLAHYLERHGMRSPAELVGRALPRIVAHGELPQRDVRAWIDAPACIRDGLCYVVCRDAGHRAIEIGAERLPRVRDERCVGCGLCRVVCPVEGCISLRTGDERDPDFGGQRGGAAG